MRRVSRLNQRVAARKGQIAGDSRCAGDQAPPGSFRPGELKTVAGPRRRFHALDNVVGSRRCRLNEGLADVVQI